MKPILLIELLQQFSNKELKGLEYIINCPYFNTDQYVVYLFNNLKLLLIEQTVVLDEVVQSNLYHIIFNSSENVQTVAPQNAAVKKRITPKTRINKKQKATLFAKISALTRLAEQFLKMEKLGEDEAVQYDLLQKAFLEKKQRRLVEQSIKKAQKKLSYLPQSIELYKFQEMLQQSILEYTFMFKGQHLNNTLLYNSKQSINQYFLIKQLELELIEHSNAKVIKPQANEIPHQEIDLKHFFNLPQYAQLPLIQLYIAAIHLEKHQKDDNYTILLKLLDEYNSQLPQYILHNFYLTALNYCMAQIKRSNFSYYHYQFEIYKTLDEKQLLLSDGQININTLKNIVGLSCRLQQFDWANYCIEKYYPFIRKDIQNDVRDYCLGIVCYYQKKYQAAIDYLFPLGNINLAFNINRRIVIMRAFYETATDYEEHTHQLFRSFESYIREHKHLTKTDKKGHLNFIRLFINLYRIKHKVSRMSLNSLKTKLDTQQFNIDKKWLVEKITELQA